MVKKFYDLKGVAYKVEEAEGTEYTELAKEYGTHVPLIYNTKKKLGMTGYNIPKLLELAK